MAINIKELKDDAIFDIKVNKGFYLMAKEVAEMGITINAVAPTPVPTDLIKTIPKNKIDLLINQQSIKRIGEYKDVLNVVDFFIKPESSFITGQIIYLGGIN
jgi:3-oxoacyl-[acyl-carrier protein] reductase